MPEPAAKPSVPEPPVDHAAAEVSVRRVMPLYLVVFSGFVGYSLMIAIFTPLVLRADGGMLPRTTSTGSRAIALGILLALYPLAQLLGAPVIGGLSDRLGGTSTLLVSRTRSDRLRAASSPTSTSSPG